MPEEYRNIYKNARRAAGYTRRRQRSSWVSVWRA